MDHWTFLTNHAHVLLCIARDPGIRLREVAEKVGITERAAQRIIAELTSAGYLSRTRVGRRNYYEVHPELPFRHPVERHREIGVLLDVLRLDQAQSTPQVPAPPANGVTTHQQPVHANGVGASARSTSFGD
jgi:hypothetical protein